MKTRRYRIFWALVAIGLCVLLAIDPMRLGAGVVLDQVAALIACAFVLALFADLWLERRGARRAAMWRHPSSQDARFIVGVDHRKWGRS